MSFDYTPNILRVMARFWREVARIEREQGIQDAAVGADEYASQYEARAELAERGGKVDA